MDRFWNKVDKSGDCWEWTGFKHKGYGRFSVGVRRLRSHRVAWELTHGPIPDGMLVLHTCDNPGCVNPDHLFLGTQADNMADMVSKGRQPFVKVLGEGVGTSKLAEDQVRSIRSDPRSQRAIARDYGVSQTAISEIKNRKRWRHIP